MTTTIRRFTEKDIPYKVKWINDEKNNQYLHYELPLREDKTLAWFKTAKDRKDRADYTIIHNDEPAGIIGLLSIDKESNDAEYYICLGEEKFKGKGIAQVATELLLREAHEVHNLSSVYLYTEVENIGAQKSFERSGFVKTDLLTDHLFHNGKYVDRYAYRINFNSDHSQKW